MRPSAIRPFSSMFFRFSLPFPATACLQTPPTRSGTIPQVTQNLPVSTKPEQIPRARILTKSQSGRVHPHRTQMHPDSARPQAPRIRFKARAHFRPDPSQPPRSIPAPRSIFPNVYGLAVPIPGYILPPMASVPPRGSTTQAKIFLMPGTQRQFRVLFAYRGKQLLRRPVPPCAEFGVGLRTSS